MTVGHYLVSEVQTSGVKLGVCLSVWVAPCESDSTGLDSVCVPASQTPDHHGRPHATVRSGVNRTPQVSCTSVYLRHLTMPCTKIDDLNYRSANVCPIKQSKHCVLI